MTSILKVDNIQNASGTSAIEIDSSGRVSMPKRPYATVCFTHNANYVAKTQNSVIDFDRILESEGNDYDTSTYKYTAPLDGLYLLTISLLTENDTDKYNLLVYKNNTLLFQPYTVFRTMQASFVVPASSGDELYFKYGNNNSYYEASRPNSTYNFATYMFMG